VVGCWHGYLPGASADLHMAQLMPLPLTVSCFSEIQIGFTFLVPAHPGSSGKRAVKWVCVCVCVMQDHWVRSDGAQATREDLMMALSQLDYIMIKAQYAKETIDSRLEKMLHIL